MSETLTTYDPEAWRQDAACRDLDTAIFFPDTEGEAELAKAVCASCPVREACLEFALVTRQDDGVWGGLDENERRRLRRRKQEAAREAARRAAA
ncbi:MAG TPA: WhiB family transcriptional regulator [Acidimicrobiales bacterium]|jgi:WhiB family redox-sensing transcriptional regulator|nr:WhiB family transcriptional regulator [Acidimicrobiales bacterium]